MLPRSLAAQAPALVVALGVAVATLIGALGLIELRSRHDAAIAHRAELLGATLAERLRAAPSTHRARLLERAALRAGASFLLVDAGVRVVADASLGTPGPRRLLALVEGRSGETESPVGRVRYHVTPLGAPAGDLALISLVPAPALPLATGPLLASIATLTLLLVGAAALVAFTYARGVDQEVAFVSHRIDRLARDGIGGAVPLVPLREPGPVGALTAALNDLVERFAAAEHAYRHDLDRALEFDRDRSAFLAALSHELRTPLNAILGFADVLLAEVDGPLGDDARENLTVLRGSAEHLRGLIDDILDLSALESGELSLSPEPMDLHDTAQEVVREARIAAEAKGLTLLLEGGPSPLVGDPRRARQILGNLVGNAVKFTREGSIRVGVRADPEAVLVEVSDTGPGIPEAQRQAIFEEYWQAPGSRRARTGTGLGLAITRRLVRMHGGSIQLRSTLGVGSTFTVALPRAPAAAARARVPSSRPPPPGPGGRIT